jgi:hypothetical protein
MSRFVRIVVAQVICRKLPTDRGAGIAKFRDGGRDDRPVPELRIRASLSRQSCCFLVKIGGKMAKHVMNLCMAARMSDAYTHMAFPLSKTGSC